MHKQKIYIAGPMTGYTDLNAAAFNMAADIFEGAGHCALNPAVLPAGLSEPEYMDICFAMIRAATAIHMLTGWEQSEGAQAEYHYAKKLGLEVLVPFFSKVDITNVQLSEEEMAEMIKRSPSAIYATPPSPARYIDGRCVVGVDWAAPHEDKSVFSKAKHPDSELCDCCCGYGKSDSGDICECCDGEGIEIKEGQ